MPAFVKMGLHSTGYATHRCVKRNTERAAGRRKVLPGFPVTRQFETLEEINQYLSGDTITCLLCGKEYRRLANHITAIHGISVEDYKIRYGLPWRRGLTSQACHKAYADALDEERRDQFRALGDKFRGLSHVASHRPPTPAHRKAMVERIIASQGSKIYEESDWTAFLENIGTGKTTQEVLRMPGMPTMTTFMSKMREDEQFKAKFLEVWRGLPFSVQARGQRLMPEFVVEVRKLFDLGWSDKKIAARLGVTAMTSNKFTKEWRIGVNDALEEGE